ncbi:MAG: hypothetical protein RKP73_08565 [Candidatus Contendobacter sp.]|nr:hypothetical protein [Candidatus Contendobacter sp.]
MLIAFPLPGMKTFVISDGVVSPDHIHYSRSLDWSGNAGTLEKGRHSEGASSDTPSV